MASSRFRAVLIFGVCSLLSTIARSQTCTAGDIPNYRVLDNTATGFIIAWDPPSPAAPGTTYEITNDYAPTECAWLNGETQRQIVGTTTQTQFTVVSTPPEHTLCFGVQVAGCPQRHTPVCFVEWNYSTPAQKPNFISAQASGPAQVTLTFSNSDNRGGLALFRRRGSEPFEFVDFLNYCPAGSTQSYTDYGDGGSITVGGKLPAGTYTYIISGESRGGRTDSDAKVVTVGTVPCTPPTVAPQVSTPNSNVVVRTQATVNWTTNEVVERYVIEVGRDPNLSTVLTSFRVPGTERSVNFTFPATGTFYLRVSAETACGRKDGVPILQFNVSAPPARVAVTAKPSGMLQVSGQGQPTSDSFTLTNLGGTSTNITLTKNNNFYNQAPTQFTLAPGASQTVIITAEAQADGNYQGETTPNGAGVPAGLVIPVRLLAASRPSGTPDARPAANRVDVDAPVGGNPTGSVTFRNAGNGTIKGILVSDVPWIIPQQEFVNIAGGETGTFNFLIDRALRGQNVGSLRGHLILIYMTGPSGEKGGSRHLLSATIPAGAKASVVSISDTVKPALSSGGIPPIAAGELAWFIPGITHAPFAGGTVKSDISVANVSTLANANNLRFFLTAAGAASNAQSTGFTSLSADQTLKLTDVTKSVFNSENQLTTLQVRTNALDTLAITADLLVVDVPNVGEFGTRIPVFRSDRAAAAGQKLHLTGLKKDASYKTDLYFQEVNGQAATVSVDLLSATGGVVATRTATVEAFGLSQITDPLPSAAVAAVVTNTSTGSARIQAYALVTDTRTSDVWSVGDWTQYYGYPMTDPVIIPVSGKTAGLNGSSFRSDLAIMNTGTSSASGTLTYYPDFGPSIDRVLTLGGRESRILTNVVETLFGINKPTAVGSLVFTPTTGSFVTSGRVYTVGGTGSTFNSSVPAVSSAFTLSAGQVKKLSGIEDATVVTAKARKAGTYRTNFGLVETKGEAVTVRATLRYTAVQGSAAAVGVSSADFALAPRQFVMFSSITSAVLRERRFDFGDLHDIQVDFEVISGNGNALVFVTTTENGTNDTSLRLE